MHQIVIRAASNAEYEVRPRSILFEAYDKVFEERGQETKHDRDCLRLVLQVARPDIPGELPIEKLEFLLAKSGIELDFTEDGLPDEAAPAEAGLESAQAEATLEWNASPRLLERRNSFTSIYDVTAEIERRATRRTFSRSSAPRILGNKPAVHKKPRRSSISVISEEMDYEVRHDHLLRLSPRRAGSAFGKRQRARGQRQQAGSPRGVDESPSFDGFEADIIATHSDEAPPAEGVQHQSVPPILSASHTQLVRDSEAFDHLRIQLLARKCLRLWHANTLHHLARIRRLQDEATHMDRKALLRSAFESWHTAYAEAQQVKQVRQMVDNHERRAIHLYDKHLKHRAFSHWFAIVQEVRAKNQAARRKYLFVKYFNAWHSFTVTSVIKTERQRLRAPFQLLRMKAAQFYKDEIDALEHYCHNLTRLVFWRWCIAHSEIKASRWGEVILSKRTFRNWRRELIRLEELNHHSVARHEENFLRSCFQDWLSRARVEVASAHRAESFRREMLLKRAIGAWRMAAYQSPLEARLVQKRDWRISRASFGIWLLRTRMIFRADFVHIQRTRQNAFCAWNEQLRSRVLNARINERLVAQAVYKWIIAQRFVLMTRIREERQKRVTLLLLTSGYRSQHNRLADIETQIRAQQQKRLARSTLECWKLQMGLEKARSQMAVDFHNPKIEQDTLTSWRLRVHHVQMLEEWATRANYYLVLNKILKRWQKARADAKKTRINETYKKVRRIIKIRQARNALGQWRSLSDRIQSLEVQGEHATRKRDQNNKVRLLWHWHRQLQDIRQNEAMVMSQYYDKLRVRSLRTWVDVARRNLDLQAQADRLHVGHMSEVCFVLLRRISMRAFEVQQRQRSADAMRERHFVKHFRNILRHWQYKVQGKKYGELMQDPSPTASFEPTDAGYGTASQDEPPDNPASGLGTTQREEEWSAFEADLYDNDEWLPATERESLRATFIQVPTPGYLNTPSKRVVRAKALAKMSTTPVTPSTKPFAARLRAGMQSSPTTGGVYEARRGALGRSALGIAANNARAGPKGDEGAASRLMTG